MTLAYLDCDLCRDSFLVLLFRSCKHFGFTIVCCLAFGAGSGSVPLMSHVTDKVPLSFVFVICFLPLFDFFLPVIVVLPYQFSLLSHRFVAIWDLWTLVPTCSNCWCTTRSSILNCPSSRSPLALLPVLPSTPSFLL